MSHQTIDINGTQFVLVPVEEHKPSPVKIVILQRGWVVVGRWFEDGDACGVTDASVIRIWGTTKGLGQLALEGPQPKTVLDKSGRIEFHRLTIVATLDTSEALWAFKL